MSPDQLAAEAQAQAVLQATEPAAEQSYEIPPTVVTE
jgi:hypothetical protein